MKLINLSGALACALALCAAPAVAAERTVTWLVPQPATPPPGLVEAPITDLFYVVPVAYEAMAELAAPYSDRDGTVAAGERLFPTDVDGGGRYYCNRTPLRAVKTQDALGVALRSSLLGGLVGAAPIPRELLWQCFGDTDGDMSFDRVGGGTSMSAAAEMVGAVSSIEKLAQPLPYRTMEGPQTSPPMSVGLYASRGKIRKGAPTYNITLCHQRTGEKAATNCYEQPKWVFRGEPLAVETLGGQITIHAIDGDPGAETVRFSVAAPFSQRFSTHTLIEMRNMVVGPQRHLLVTPKK